MKKLRIKLIYVIRALRAINRPHLGDKVIYDGIECILIQGVASPYWDMIPLTKENLSLNRRVRFNRIHEKDFKLEPIWKRFGFSFRHTYRFYMRNWFDIDLRNSAI